MCKSNSWLLYTMLNIQISINKGLWLYFNTKFFSKFNDLNDNAIIIVRFQMSKFIRNAVTLLTQWSLNFQMSKLISKAVPLFTQWSGNFQMSKLISNAVPLFTQWSGDFSPAFISTPTINDDLSMLPALLG